MTESIRKTILFESAKGTVYSIRLTNNTGDYIDLTNYGARLIGVHVHTPGGGMENLAPVFEIKNEESFKDIEGTLLGGSLKAELSAKIWDIVEINQTSVMFTTETDNRIKIGLQITWVNLNRFILDIFATPEKNTEIDLQPHMELACRTYEISCFCPQVNGQNTADTVYADMMFRALKSEAEADVFSDTNDAIKPMLELKDAASPLRVSFYSTQHQAKAWVENDLVCFASYEAEPVSVQANATLAERAIWGFDYITTNLASDENDPESPFLGFF